MSSNNDKKQMATSDFNMLKLTTKELSEHVAATIQVGGNIMIFGRRGTGKTEISKFEIGKSKLREVYINLSVFERVDLGGYPNIISAEKERKFVDFLLPKFYQPMLEGSEGVVALLDEVDKADPSIWAPLLEFTQFRSINGATLPNLRAIIMTGNLISEGGLRPSLPLLDRAEKYIVEADASSWLEWSGKRGGIHPSITAFISDNTPELFGNTDPGDRFADTSPRGWHRASDILYAGEKKNWSLDLLNKKVCGCVGKDAGLKYFNYYEHYQQLLPMVDDIFRGLDVRQAYNKLEPTKRVIITMIVCSRFANLLDSGPKDKKEAAIPVIARFLHNVHSEVVLTSVRSQIQKDRILDNKLDFNEEWEALFKKTRIGNKCSGCGSWGGEEQQADGSYLCPSCIKKPKSKSK